MRCVLLYSARAITPSQLKQFSVFVSVQVRSLYSQSQPTAQSKALIDAALPASGFSLGRRLAREAALIVGFALITALFARITIPLGFTPVPITGQTLAVLLTGATLGSRRGAASMALYLVAGSWLPLYAGGASGYVWNMASGGYIIGFIPAAFVVGFLAERGWDRRIWIVLAMLAGNVALYIPGLLQLSFFVPEGKVLAFGLYPFIPGDIIKLCVASLTVPGAWALLKLRQGS